VHRSTRPSKAVASLDDRRADLGRALALIWAGMVLGVSFLATPVKFLAPSLSLPIALDVGRHTFRTFGRLEMALSALLGLRAAASERQQGPLALAPGLLVLAQALWLRPRLDARTRQIAQNGVTTPPSSGLHPAYVACEVAKLAALLTLGLRPRSAVMGDGQ